MHCCQVLSWLKLTVLRPLSSVSATYYKTRWMKAYAKVMALTHKNRLSVKLMLLAGVEEPQKITADMRQVTMKYA